MPVAQTGDNPVFWRTLLKPYIKSDGILQCPDDDTKSVSLCQFLLLWLQRALRRRCVSTGEHAPFGQNAKRAVPSCAPVSNRFNDGFGNHSTGGNPAGKLARPDSVSGGNRRQCSNQQSQGTEGDTKRAFSRAPRTARGKSQCALGRWAYDGPNRFQFLCHTGRDRIRRNCSRLLTLPAPRKRLAGRNQSLTGQERKGFGFTLNAGCCPNRLHAARADGVGKPGGFFQIPAAQKAEQKARRPAVARAQSVYHGHSQRQERRSRPQICGDTKHPSCPNLTATFFAPASLKRRACAEGSVSPVSCSASSCDGTAQSKNGSAGAMPLQPIERGFITVSKTVIMPRVCASRKMRAKRFAFYLRHELWACDMKHFRAACSVPVYIGFGESGVCADGVQKRSLRVAMHQNQRCRCCRVCRRAPRHPFVRCPASQTIAA